jgi:aryl-alcohol dehydrogenase-like predicted oxidoreductase
VNFIDTAEMYPVPSSAPGWKPGLTEEFIGTWLAKNPTLRSEVVIASKVSGFNPGSETGGRGAAPVSH